MASSRSSRSSDLVSTVAGELRAVLFPGAHLLAGLSGGIDSVALLAILCELAEPMRFSLRALHINHGISPNARQWEDFCLRLCARLRVPLAIEQVDISPFRSMGIEGAARAARYAAYARHAADFLVLAQHRDDQAETLLLQLMRGAGPAGLSGMASLKPASEASLIRHGLLRPLLEVGRREIEEFVRARSLEWIEDESNEDTSRDRNFLRHRVLPLLEERFPHARGAVARSAGYLAQVAALAEELGRADLDALRGEEGLDVHALRRLGESRGKNALRVSCRLAGAPVPGAARLEELWKQLIEAREDAQPSTEFQGWTFRRYRGRLYLERFHRTPSPAEFRASWKGESALPLLELGGVLQFKPEEGKGLSVEKLHSGPVTVRLRRGGEHLRPDPRRPRRTLKNLLQERCVPPWRRALQPLLYCGETLVSVPGVGDECTWQAAPGERGLIVSWEWLA